MKNSVQTTLLALALLAPTTGFAMQIGETGSTQESAQSHYYNDPATEAAPTHLAIAPGPAFLEHEIQLDGSLLIAKTIFNNIGQLTAGACALAVAGLAYWYQTAR